MKECKKYRESFPNTASAKIAENIRAIADSCGGLVSWSGFVRECLYSVPYGYYVKDAKRVGREGADFFTSQSLNPGLLARLLGCAAKKFTGFGVDGLDIFEIADEPGERLFEKSRIFRLGDDINIESGRALIFANELPDALPFDRFVNRSGAWKKRMIDPCGLSETEADLPAGESAALGEFFPAQSYPEGFCLDYSFESVGLFERIMRMPWRGVLIFADYFRTAAELADFPRGTARGYFKHSQFADLLEGYRRLGAGNFDMTFSPPEEPFIEAAGRTGACEARCVSQEKFFVENCFEAVDDIIRNEGPLSTDKRSLAELMSPSGMGSAFKILYAVKK